MTRVELVLGSEGSEATFTATPESIAMVVDHGEGGKPIVLTSEQAHQLHGFIVMAFNCLGWPEPGVSSIGLETNEEDNSGD